MNKIEIDYNNQKLSIETGKLAKQADGSVVVQYGETIVLVTAVASKSNESNLDYFPLTCNYQFKHYSQGNIPGGFFKRETRPSDKESLISRMIDRPIRPLFPKEFKAETQIIATVLNYNSKFSPEIPAILGASAAITISDIPFIKPVAAAIVGYDGKDFILNPPEEESEQQQLELNLLVVASKDAILMVESEANQLSEDKMIEALEFAHKSIIELIEIQEKLKAEVGIPKRKIEKIELESEIKEKINGIATTPLIEALKIKIKKERYEKFDFIKSKIIDELKEEYDENKSLIDDYFSEIKGSIMRKMILDEDIRVDGRKSNQIRPISCESSFLPNVHGSALFTRGETQALVTVTLGSKDDEQFIDEPPKGYFKKFFLHYNFPPFSVGEAGRLGPPGRREIGHGRLAERSLSKVLPTHKEFPYTIRIVSEILESNGSSSMATVCGGTLALQCAKVPISKPVAGIAMGLIYSPEKSVILSDILGDEDHLGDMDFKVAGTDKGITSLQMDIKTEGISMELLKQALQQANEGRLHIISEMEKVKNINLKSSTNNIPKNFQFKIPVNKIREVIGPGGQVIKSIIAETGTKIDINDNGMINIISTNQKNAEKALTLIQQKIGLLQIGQAYNGIIKNKNPIGFFVECLPNIDGLVPIAEIENPDLLNEGDRIMVKVAGYDRRNRLQLTLEK